jgi:hypothetical protein
MCRAKSIGRWYRSKSSALRLWSYYLAMLAVFSAWTLRQFARGDAASRTSQAARRKFIQAIVSSGLLLAIALGRVLFAHMGWVVGFARCHVRRARRRRECLRVTPASKRFIGAS